MRIYVDASPLYDLGMIGETGLLSSLSGDLVVPSAVQAEVDVEPAARNLATLLEETASERGAAREPFRETAVDLLGDGPAANTELIAGVLAERDAADERPCCGLVSDDQRVRRLADGLGAAVSSTFGVVVNATLTDKYFPTSQAKRVLRRLDGHGLVTTGPVREQAYGDVGE